MATSCRADLSDAFCQPLKGRPGPSRLTVPRNSLRPPKPSRLYRPSSRLWGCPIFTASANPAGRARDRAYWSAKPAPPFAGTKNPIANRTAQGQDGPPCAGGKSLLPRSKRAGGWGLSLFAALDPMVERKPAEAKARTARRAARVRVRCGARTRKGTACRNLSESGKRCCKFHGGRSTGPRTPEGRERIAEAQRRRWAAWRVGLRRQFPH